MWIRFADINTPEIETEEGKEAKEYVKRPCDNHLSPLLRYLRLRRTPVPPHVGHLPKSGPVPFPSQSLHTGGRPILSLMPVPLQ